MSAIIDSDVLAALNAAFPGSISQTPQQQMALAFSQMAEVQAAGILTAAAFLDLMSLAYLQLQVVKATVQVTAVQTANQANIATGNSNLSAAQALLGSANAALATYIANGG